MSGKKNIHEGHRQRLKRKLLNSDDEEILPHEALEALLFYALPQKNTNEIAHELIQRFGGISRVFEANMSDLMQVGRSEGAYRDAFKAANDHIQDVPKGQI